MKRGAGLWVADWGQNEAGRTHIIGRHPPRRRGIHRAEPLPPHHRLSFYPLWVESLILTVKQAARE